MKYYPVICTNLVSNAALHLPIHWLRVWYIFWDVFSPLIMATSLAIRLYYFVIL